MNLPEQPPTFRSTAQPEHLWWWRLEDSTGGEVEDLGDAAEQRFPSRADAETWIGETWSDLLARGVEAVTLLEGDRAVYGPMSLRA